MKEYLKRAKNDKMSEAMDPEYTKIIKSIESDLLKCMDAWSKKHKDPMEVGAVTGAKTMIKKMIKSML